MEMLNEFQQRLLTMDDRTDAVIELATALRTIHDVNDKTHFTNAIDDKLVLIEIDLYNILKNMARILTIDPHLRATLELAIGEFMTTPDAELKKIHEGV